MDYTANLADEKVTVEVDTLPNAKVFLAEIYAEDGKHLATFGESGPNLDSYVHNTSAGVSLDFVHRIASRVIRENRNIVTPA